MQLRRLGRSDIYIPSLMFGGNVFDWTADKATSFRLLDSLIANGLNAIDTADVYSAWVPGHAGGESETVIGEWLKQRGGRDKIIIATKVGMKMGSGDQGLSKDWIVRAAEDSLTRLGVDYIDLYQAHKDDADTPLEETLAAFAKLKEQGKVRAVGASNYSAARLKKALDLSARSGLARFESLQPHYNLMERALFEPELGPLCQAEELGVIPYFSLASGFLTGKYRSEKDLEGRTRGGGVKKYVNDRGMHVLHALDEAAAAYKATPAQVSLAWLMARPGVTAAIASATSLEQLMDLVKATALTLRAETISALDQASA